MKIESTYGFASQNSRPTQPYQNNTSFAALLDTRTMTSDEYLWTHLADLEDSQLHFATQPAKAPMLCARSQNKPNKYLHDTNQQPSFESYLATTHMPKMVSELSTNRPIQPDNTPCMVTKLLLDIKSNLTAIVDVAQPCRTPHQSLRTAKLAPNNNASFINSDTEMAQYHLFVEQNAVELTVRLKLNAKDTIEKFKKELSFFLTQTGFQLKTLIINGVTHR